MWFWREREAVLSAWERLESGEDVVDLSPAGVIGVDVDEPHNAVAVDDQDGRHRQYGAAVRTSCSFSCQVRCRVLVGCETGYPSHLMCVCLEASPSLAAEGLVAFAVVGCQDADELLVEIDVDQRAGLDDADARTDILDR